MAFGSCLMACVLSVAGQTSPMGTTRVAVVNVGTVSEKYLRTAELEAKFEQKRVALNAQRIALEEKIERTRRSLQEELKPGTPEFNERRKQLAMLDAELQWFMESEGQGIEFELAQSLRQIFGDIQLAVREVAKEQKIDLVLSTDQLPPETPPKTAQARQQILLQKVLYFAPQTDITDQVVARVNSIHKAKTAPGAAPATNQP